VKGGLSIETLGIMVLTLIVSGVFSLTILDFRDQSPEIHPIEKSMENSDYPVCEEFEKNQTVDREGFRTLLYGRHLKSCGIEKNKVELGFVLEKSFVEKLAEELSSSPEVLYRDRCEDIPGFNGFVVEASEERIGVFGEKIILNNTDPVKICQG
jgi:hypothetical protein